MHTLIRDQDTSKHDFVFYSDRLIRLVCQSVNLHNHFYQRQFAIFIATTFSSLLGSILNDYFEILIIELVELLLQIVEHGLGHLAFTEKQVITPTGALFGPFMLSLG